MDYFYTWILKILINHYSIKYNFNYYTKIGGKIASMKPEQYIKCHGGYIKIITKE